MPLLQAGDEVKNAVLTIVKLLKRADKIPQLKDIEDTQLPRVQGPKVNSSPNHAPHRSAPFSSNKNPATPNIIPFEQNELSKPTAIDALCTSTLPKNVRFRNTSTNSYNLQSKTNVNVIQHISSQFSDEQRAQTIFGPNMHINHIYDEKGKRETIDSLITGKNKDIWNCSLSN